MPSEEGGWHGQSWWFSLTRVDDAVVFCVTRFYTLFPLVLLQFQLFIITLFCWAFLIPGLRGLRFAPTFSSPCSWGRAWRGSCPEHLHGACLRLGLKPWPCSSSRFEWLRALNTGCLPLHTMFCRPCCHPRLLECVLVKSVAQSKRKAKSRGKDKGEMQDHTMP